MKVISKEVNGDRKVKVQFSNRPETIVVIDVVKVLQIKFGE